MRFSHLSQTWPALASWPDFSLENIPSSHHPEHRPPSITSLLTGGWVSTLHQSKLLHSLFSAQLGLPRLHKPVRRHLSESSSSTGWSCGFLGLQRSMHGVSLFKGTLASRKAASPHRANSKWTYDIKSPSRVSRGQSLSMTILVGKSVCGWDEIHRHVFQAYGLPDSHSHVFPASCLSLRTSRHFIKSKPPWEPKTYQTKAVFRRKYLP